LTACAAEPLTPPTAAETEAALRGFDEPAGQASTASTLHFELQSASPERVKDVAALLGYIVLVGLALWGLKRATGAQFRVPVALSLAVAVPLVFATNPLFWQWHQVDLDSQLVRVALYNEAPVELPWSDVVGARLEPGKRYPLFVDDAVLVLVGRDGRAARILRGPVQPRAVVAFIRAHASHLGKAAEPPK
jgi:hypothetical protein